MSAPRLRFVGRRTQSNRAASATRTDGEVMTNDGVTIGNFMDRFEITTLNCIAIWWRIPLVAFGEQARFGSVAIHNCCNTRQCCKCCKGWN
jgi:hypothetical protein